MEIPKFWRLRQQRYNLIGLKDKETGEVEFPPKANFRKKKNVVYESGLLFSPNNQVVHSEVVGKNQE